MSGLDQRDDRGTKAQFSLTEVRAGGGRDNNRRADTPDQLAGFCRREKEGRVHVPNPILAPTVCGGGRLPHNRLNDSRDQHPLFADASGNHRLNVEHVLGAIVRPDTKVRIVLKGNADKTGDGILRGLGQASRVIRGRRRRGRHLGLRGGVHRSCPVPIVRQHRVTALRPGATGGIVSSWVDSSTFDPTRQGGVRPLVQVAVGGGKHRAR